MLDPREIAIQISPAFPRERLPFVARAGGKPTYLDDLRNVGPFSDAGCALDIPHHGQRCVYWLWTRGDAYRGIEVTFRSKGPTDEINARYIVYRE